MNKIIVLIMICIFVFIGCATGQLYKLPTSDGAGSYEVYKEFHDDIENSFYMIGALFYEGDAPLFGSTWVEVVTINKWVFENNANTYTFKLSYMGTSWRFMDEFRIKIDGELFIFTPALKYRDVVNFGKVGVMEIYDFEISNEIVNKLLNANAIKMQYYNSPITLDESQIQIIKSFLIDSEKYTYESNL